ncbi:hypothetical protein YB2330_004993 [Saitoella coloradoensis]
MLVQSAPLAQPIVNDPTFEAINVQPEALAHNFNDEQVPEYGTVEYAEAPMNAAELANHAQMLEQFAMQADELVKAIDGLETELVEVNEMNVALLAHNAPPQPRSPPQSPGRFLVPNVTLDDVW